MTTDEQIRQIVRQINALERNIDRERSAAAQAVAKKQRFEHRRNDVKSIRDRAYRDFDSSVSHISHGQRNIVLSLSGGLKGTSNAVASQIEGTIERNFENDSVGGQIINCLSSEIAQCESEIRNAESAAATNNRNVDNYLNQRKQLVTKGKRLEKEDDATIKLNKGYWY